MWDWLSWIYKFFEYAPLYIALVLVPALLRSIIDTVVIKIPPSAFQLPPKPARENTLVAFEDAFASFVSASLYAPLVEEIVFRACPYIFLGFAGLVVGNIVWILAHPVWQLRYVTDLPLRKKIAFTVNTVFYYACASVFFSIPWLQGYGLLAIIYHMAHNGILTLGGIFSEIELPAPWKREESEFFRESRGFKKKLEERFFKDTNPPEIPIDEEELELDVDISGNKFIKELEKSAHSRTKLPKMKVKSKEQQVNKEKKVVKAVAYIGDDWLFWKN